MNKKYYWLKLHNDFFRQIEIKKLRTLENGDLYTLIYLKLQLLSITTSGQLFSLGSEDSLAYDLALELDEKLADIEKVLLLLEKYHLLEIVAKDCLQLTKVADVIGSEAASTERVRRMRRSNIEQALQCNTDVTNSNTEKELELKIEVDKEINESRTHIATHTHAYYEKNREDKIPLIVEPVVKAISPVISETITATTIAIIDTLPTNLSAKEDLIEPPAKDPALLGIQIITQRILARLEAEKLTNPPHIIPALPAIHLENSFEDFWHYYPKSYDRASTHQVWLKTLEQGISAVDLVCAAQKYASEVKNQKTLDCYISSSRNFLLNNKFWKFLPTYLANCPNCKGNGVFAKVNVIGELQHYRCNCHQRYQQLSAANLITKASA